ncbi:NAD-dependent epimerase/dehydratase family protein [Vibrio anguillarum]|uniref:NAD-dependent epimerase/dehydratase family protein n=1 Tax=Vibrio anguillarum TaxID=55601 RepID=UPI0002F81AEA|nr:NAD-dependent epimerase/dehydratase family protein [Vibrio anguillarum]OEE38958.1 NAD-dependent dehydratase [Vibrio anguillarum]
MSKRVLIIGGAGAIGGNLVSKLLDECAEVLVVDNFSSGRLANVDESALVSYCDIFDRDKIDDIIQKFNPNYIYNLAAHFANQNSVDYPYEDIKTNIIGQINVLESCKRLKSLKKYVYASSSCVYGHVEQMQENASIYPCETPYAINKYAAELYTKYYSEQFGVPTASVRIFNTFGEGEMAGKYRNVIPNFIDKALKNEDIRITGDGSETRDFTYVSDTVRCLTLAAESEFKNGEVFNSGTGIETEIKYLAEMIIKICNSESKVVFKERRDWDSVKNRVSNIDRTNKLLGYKPSVSLIKGLENTINWYRVNQDEKSHNSI